MLFSIITFPLFSSLSIYIFSKYIGKQGGKIISVMTMIIMGIMSIKLLIENIKTEKTWMITIYNWIEFGPIKTSIGIEYKKKG